MNEQEIINKLEEKYKATGKIGFFTPISEDQAVKVIKTLAKAYVSGIKE